jgi:hypothetical protein
MANTKPNNAKQHAAGNRNWFQRQLRAAQATVGACSGTPEIEQKALQVQSTIKDLEAMVLGYWKDNPV